jgi:hypothetical protein
MSGVTFLVESFKVNEGSNSIFWNGKKLITKGHLICSGDDYRFLVYFVDDNDIIPKPEYIKKYKLGAIFVAYSDMEAYVKLSEEKEPVYAYLNAQAPELNCLSVNEPVREDFF